MQHVTTPETLLVHEATRFRTRLLGLLALPRLRPGEALALQPCGSVHTCFMRYAIDVVYLDADDAVIKVVPALAPWRVSACWRARTTLEMAAGEAARLQIRPGTQFARPARHGPAAYSFNPGFSPWPVSTVSPSSSTPPPR